MPANKSKTNVMRSGKGRILFVEDERELLNIYHILLEKEGYDFLSTKDIQEALTVTEAEQPDAVMLDIIISKPENTMAEQGWEYLKAVKENSKTKNIPIIVFTNLDTPKDREKSKKMGAAAYIFKRACTPREAMEAMAEVIRKERGEKEDKDK
ncbi:MAG: response regulator [bacterium]|nr:response regulator [bacterium]